MHKFLKSFFFGFYFTVACYRKNSQISPKNVVIQFFQIRITKDYKYEILNGGDRRSTCAGAAQLSIAFRLIIIAISQISIQ